MTKPRMFWRVLYAVLVLGAGLVLPPAIAGEGAGPVAKIPAFPGAEGAGAYTPGGRGGKVFLITNLNDQGPGSLREAVEANGPRMVVFRVAGIIHSRRAGPSRTCRA
jgi:hypothetical protein